MGSDSQIFDRVIHYPQTCIAARWNRAAIRQSYQTDDSEGTTEMTKIQKIAQRFNGTTCSIQNIIKNVHGDDLAEDPIIFKQYRYLPREGRYEMSTHHTGYARVIAVNNSSAGSSVITASNVSTFSTRSANKVSF